MPLDPDDPATWVLPEISIPPRSKSHNWPSYTPPRKTRAKIVRPLPVSDLELAADPSLKPTYPICGGSVSAPPTQTERDKVCQKPAGTGTHHPGFGPCSAHSGGTKVVRRSSALQAGQAFINRFKAEATLFGGDPSLIQLTPQEALMEEVRRSVAMVRYLQEQIASWNPDDLNATSSLGLLPQLVDETTRGINSPTDAAEWLRLYRDERAHMVRVAKMAIDAGVSMMMVQLAQQQGLLVAMAVKQILDRLDLSPAQAQLVPVVVPEVLSAVARGFDDSQVPNGAPILTGAIVE